MSINEAGLALLRKFEGLRLSPYQDQAGVPSCGYGHTQGVTMDMPPITEDVAERFLLQDVRQAEVGVRCLVSVPLNDNQLSALVCFVFNVGAGKLRGSKTIDVLNRRCYLEFADRMLLWDKVRDAKTGEFVESAGLKARREAERALFLTPVVVRDNGPVNLPPTPYPSPIDPEAA